jgi:ADP-ribosylglycohydrolase
MRDLDRFRGCLLGGTVGDALGYAVEFCGEEYIFSQYGRRGITEYELRGGVAEISDDTQMTLFTAEGLIRAGEGRDFTDSIYRSYLDWYRTQTERYPLPGGHGPSRLLDVPRLFSRRAPGNTCLSALGSGGCGSTAQPINRSKGCGGVMRVAPVGLFFCDSATPIADSDRLSAEAAAITHGQDLGWLPAAALAHIVRRLAENEGETVASAVESAIQALGELYPHAERLDVQLALLEKAAALARADGDDLDAIHRLGEGWVGEEALAIAVYCALKYPDDFEQAMIASVNHRGDSDSTGAITGNILGAALGRAAIPAKYLEKLELREVIEDTADRLFFAGAER